YESEEAVLVDHGDMSMVIDMNDEKLKTLDQIRNFMAGTEGVEFCHQPGKDNRYQ
ncbi:MAG: Phosphate regulon sensor protein PhoR, partial [Synergistales bacterium 57_84]